MQYQFLDMYILGVMSNSAGNGQYLACGCADKATYTVKMPPASERVHTFVGTLTNIYCNTIKLIIQSSLA